MDLADPDSVDAPVMTLEIPAQREDGVSLGPLPAGTAIHVQYVGGKWKAWGGLATENPDAEDHERVDQSRLVIADYPDPRRLSEVLTTVPPNTDEQAFRYTLEEPAENLVLRIHNGGRSSFKDNPGSVRYRVMILTP